MATMPLKLRLEGGEMATPPIHRRRAPGRSAPPTGGRALHAARRSDIGSDRTHKVVAVFGTGFLVSAGLFGGGVLASSPGGAVACIVPPGPPSASDGQGNVCTAGASAFADAGDNGNAFALLNINPTDTGSGNAITVDQFAALMSSGGISATAAGNSATAAGNGAVALAGSMNDGVFAIENISYDVSGNNDTIMLAQSSTVTETGDATVTATGDTANANGAGATALAGSENGAALSIELMTVDIAASNETLTYKQSNNETAGAVDVTADDDTATADGAGASAVAGSQNDAIVDTDIIDISSLDPEANDDTATADGAGSSASAGSDNSAPGALTADGDVAVATDGGTAYAGSDNFLESGTLVASDNRATANGAGASAFAASFGSGGVDNTATATADSTSSATSDAGSGDAL